MTSNKYEAPRLLPLTDNQLPGMSPLPRECIGGTSAPAVCGTGIKPKDLASRHPGRKRRSRA